MFITLYRSIKMTLALAVIVCGVYPLLMFVVGCLLFPDQARGSLVSHEGKVVGSRLIGQAFTRPEYFHGRPSAAGERGYDAANSSGSNLGPTSDRLLKSVAERVARFKETNGVSGDVPVDIVTASASGLDPHISPEAALAQVTRVARARNVPEGEITSLLSKLIQGPQWGLLGEATVNVLVANLELDRLTPARPMTSVRSR